MAKGKHKREDNTEEQVFKAMEGEQAEDEDNELMDEAAAVEEELSELEKASRLWQQEKDELTDQLKRKQADIDNLRRIGKTEQAEAREYALHGFLSRLIPVLDNLERGLETARLDKDVPPAYVEGLEMIHKQLVQIIEQEEVSVIEAVGCTFDPHCHHAVIQVDQDESESGIILEELQKGYRHRKRILRPSMVKVCR